MAQSIIIRIPLESLANFGRRYSLALENQPILTKSITSGILAALGNLIGQTLQNRNFKEEDVKLKWRSVVSCLIFGVGVNGPISHFYLNWLEKYGPRSRLAKLIIDRLIYGPSLLYLTLYLLPIFQGQGLTETRKFVRKMYCEAFKASLKFWTICQYINLNFVPLQYRTLFASLVSLLWNVYLSTTTTKLPQNQKRKETSKK